MKRILLLLFVSMLMAESAVAVCVFTIDDFTVTPDQIGTEIALPVKAYFSARVDAWQVDFTYPEGLTPTYAEAGADFGISYINSNGGTAICTPLFVHNNDYSRVMAAANDLGYWYDPDTDDLTNYGTVKWEGGTYEEMFILYVEVTEDFHGGQIIMTTVCSSGYDSRGETVRENGDHGVSFTHECNVTLGGPEAYACYTPSNTTLTFYYDNLRSSRTGTTYDLNTGNNVTDWETSGTNVNVTRVVFNSSFANARPTTTYSWFYDMWNLQSITGISYLNTSEVTNMAWMFAYCSNLTSLDLSGFNTANVTNMRYMFENCSGLTSLDVSHFNTSKVTNMGYMFRGCELLTSLDVRSFNTSRVTNMESMFDGLRALTSLDLSNFNTSNVTNMSNMFWDCQALTSLDLSSFNTAQVTDMHYMFDHCNNLVSVDLSSFNTSKVTHVNYMFNYCSKLTTIYAGSEWTTNAVTSSTDMFADCTNLVGGMGTTYDPNHIDGDYAHIDGGPSNPGYFTAKVDYMRGDVNGDGQVKIGDVTALINYLLSSNATGVNLQAADCNQDGQIKIGDVTALINYLLSGTW